MRVLRDKKGFYLIELLVVLVILAFILLLFIKYFVWDTIDDARGTTLMNQARSVSYAATVALLEIKASGETIDDYDIALGLGGTVTDPSKPAQMKLSNRMNALLAPDVVLSEEPGEGCSKAVFEVKDGVVVSLLYEAMLGERLYAVYMPVGGEATVERVK